jgi:FtsX-like permease family protein
MMNRFLSEGRQDIRYGVRQLLQYRSFAIVTIFILALGIGATTAVFSILNTMILRPLPVRDPQRLVTLSAPFRANAGLRTYWSYAIWQQIRNNRKLFDGTMAWSQQRFKWAGPSWNDVYQLRHTRMVSNLSLLRERAVAQISGWFGAVALVLANIGLYGLMSYSVSRRRAEMGIRIALGGTPAMIMRMVFRRAYLLVLPGIGLGSVVAFWASRFVASLLYQIDPHDTENMAAAAFALILAATVAVWLPAARISRTDPATVLKVE